MDIVPSTMHVKLKFEYQGEVHIILDDPKPYALCNVIDFEEFTMGYP